MSSRKIQRSQSGHWRTKATSSITRGDMLYVEAARRQADSEEGLLGYSMQLMHHKVVNGRGLTVVKGLPSTSWPH
jgi:hypothetical protein